MQLRLPQLRVTVQCTGELRSVVCRVAANKKRSLLRHNFIFHFLGSRKCATADLFLNSRRNEDRFTGGGGERGSGGRRIKLTFSEFQYF